MPLTTAKGSPPGDAVPPPPQRATTAHKSARCGAGAGSPRPHQRHPGHTAGGTPAACLRGWAAGERLTPDPPRNGRRPPPSGTALHHPRGTHRPTEHASQGDIAGPPHLHTRTHSKCVADPDSPPRRRAAGDGERLNPDAPRSGERHPPRGRPPATPTARNNGSQERTLRDP